MRVSLYGAAGWVGTSAMAALLCAGAARAQPAAEQDYDLPEQELARSLRDVATRSGAGVIAPTPLVEGRRAGALNGRYSPRRAVEALISGSGLRVEQVGGALVVSPGEPGADGLEAAAGSEEADTIVVTGTNLRGGEATSQVLSIGRAEIEASGSLSVEQLVRKLPQNTGAGVSQENFGVPGAGSDITEHGAGVNLRGLGQRATLVLLNGRRVAPGGVGSFVDISLIPASAIERVEILTDGASAIYGSDAVGGVVNFILRDRFEGLETSLQAGSATKGDGDQLQVAGTLGDGWGNGRALLAYEYRLEDEIVAGDRDFTINLAPSTSLVPRERRHSLFGILTQDLSDRLTAEITAFHARRDSERSYFFLSSPLAVGAVAEAVATNVTGNFSYDLGGDWVAQLDGGYSLSRTEQLQTQPGGQELINERNIRTSLGDLGLKLDGSLLDLPGGAVRVALGAQGRRETYREEFATSVNTPTVQRKRRHVGALFGEIYVPIVSERNRLPGVERLAVTGALRYERYDGFGSTLNPKLGALWSPISGLSLRGSYDTSFRAPLLSESTAFFNAFYLPAPLLHLDPSQGSGVALALGGSNPDVRPEESRTWTIGADWRPPFTSGLALTANYYSIRFSDRIGLPTETLVVIGDPAFEPIITRSPTVDVVQGLLNGATLVIDVSGPGFTNGGATPGDVTVIVDGRTNNSAVTRTSGVDFGLQYAFDVGANRFTLHGNANYVFTFEDQLTRASPPVETLGTPFHTLRFRARAGLGWSRGGWNGNLFLNHASGYRDDRGAADRAVGSFTTIDAGLAYEFGRGPAGGWLSGTRLGLQVQNLLDTDPPRLLPEPGSTSDLGYDPVNASGRGRFVSVQLRKTW